MTHLSEDKIKRIALGFLKTYYKFRPRAEGKTVARYDVQTVDGIIADGYLSYPLESGADFIVTFEATSYDTHEEVIYKLQHRLLNWDSLAMAGLLTAFGFSLALAKQWISIQDFGLWGLLGLIVGSGLLAFYFLSMTLRLMQRYRYIYAIEQFKRYHADEQWIAIADDVFNGPNDRYLKELKNQCVYNGFGLLSVTRSEQAQMLITPSRQEVFGQTRSNLAISLRDQAFHQSRQQHIRRKFNALWNRLLPRRSFIALDRYQRNIYKQLTLFLISLGIIAGVFFRQLDYRLLEYVDEQAYETSISEKAKVLDAEKEGYLLDTARMPSRGEENYSYLDHPLELIPDEVPESSKQSAQFELVEMELLEFNAQPNRSAEIYVTTDNNQRIEYNCERLYNFTGTIYLIQYAAHPTMGLAQQKIDEMEDKGFKMNVLWLGCFSKDQLDYVVYYDLLYNDREEALVAANQFRNDLKKKNLRPGKITLRSLRKK
ncbi:MAG: hypothetical protein AAF985_12825 [Bacteroidota bacterium]